MTEDANLLKKRAELKSELAICYHKALVIRFTEGTGRLIQKIARRPAPITSLWYQGAVPALLILLIGCIVSLLLGESLTLEMILLAIWGVFMGALVLIQATLGTRLLLTTLQESTVEAMTSLVNLEKLQHWLLTTFDLKKQFMTSLIIGLMAGLSTPFFWGTIRGDFPGFGPITGVALIGFQAGMGWYFIFPLLTWISQAGHYQLKLYEADPSNSEVIDRLSDVTSGLVFIGAILGAIFTLGLIYFRLLNVIISIPFLVLGTWGPLGVIFIASQYALARIISRSKWKTLNEIQAQVEELKTKSSLVDKETMEAMTRLMDYHDRVRATRNSALDLRSGLSFLNSLLLPLIAFILANLDNLIAFFT